MKTAIYSPYLDTFGGGEKYMMTIAEVCCQAGYKVDVLLSNHLNSLGPELLRKQLSERFNLDLSNVNFIKAPIGKGSNLFNRLFFLKNYDSFFYLTDGSIFISTADKNILHIQTPLVGQPAKSIWGKIKLKFWNLIIYNSQFTKANSDKNWPLSSEVVFPPVDIDKIKPLQKKNYILSVGRFFGYLKDKKHELMIKTFKKLVETKRIVGWSLNLVGSANSGDEPYLMQLKSLAKGLPINFYPNLSYDDLVKLYGQSSIYWHASGFGENEPTKMEHFGIATVEAMAAGCVPVVIRKGGQIEIVGAGSGFLWNDPGEFQEYTMKVISDKALREKIGKKAIEKTRLFSKKNFKEKILEVLR